MDETLLGIGQMAQRSGLTVSALRFYAGASVLEPATIDPATGYRWYGEGQVRQARLIAQLRRVAMPLLDIRRILAAGDDLAAVSEIAGEYLRRLEADLVDARHVLSTIPNHLNDLETRMPSTMTLPAPHLYSGKVRELYDAGAGRVLVVASDRISAFDFVLPTEVPGKGAILTQLSAWWFDQLADVAPSHVITTDVASYPEEFADSTDWLRGRSMLCRRLGMLPVECVVRGYLTGSALVEYQRTGSAHGIPLAPGLTEGSRLPEPIFTPTTKAPNGRHDEAMTFEDVVASVGPARAEELRDLSLAVYRRAADIAEGAGLIVADTKLEFGVDADGRLALADEVLTPDSSRFWPAGSWEPGRQQRSFDKQFVRDWLTGDSGWDRVGPPPALPSEVVAATHSNYVAAFERLTGRSFTE